MTKLRGLILNYLWNAFTFLILCGMASFAAMMLYKDIKIAYAQILFIIPAFINLEIRQRARNVFVFFGATLIVFAASSYVGAMMGSGLAFYRIFTCLFMAVITMVSVFRRFSSTPEDITVPFVVLAISVNAALSISSGAFGIPELELFYVAFSLVQILAFIIYIRIKRLDIALELIESTTVQPFGRIIGFNNLLTVIFVLLVAAAGILSVVLRSKNIIIYSGRALLNFIRFLAGLSKSEPEPLEDAPMPEMPQGEGLDLSMFGEAAGTSPLIVFLEKIFIFASSVAIVAGIVFGICYFFYWIYKRFSATLPGNGDEKEFLIKDAQELITERANGFVSNIRNFFIELLPGGDNNKKVRRIFYKRVAAHISHGVGIKTGDTPSEIKSKIMEKEDISRLTEVYGKARYSKEQITDSDIASCKK